MLVDFEERWFVDRSDGGEVVTVIEDDPIAFGGNVVACKCDVKV